MAIEQIELNTASGGAKIGTDRVTISAVDTDFQIVKIGISADGTEPVQVSAANPLPVTGTITAVTDITNTVTVDGTVNVGTIAADVATETTLAAQSAKLPATLGQKAKAASLAVTLASDEDSIAITAASLPLPTGAATAALQLADGHNVTVDNASIAITAAALPLPAGAATSALQLADGHNVTIDNAGGGAAVNIQDGGNTITVDGSVTVSATALDVRALTNADIVTAELSATDNAVLDLIASNQTDASQKAQVVDGAGDVMDLTSPADAYSGTAKGPILMARASASLPGAANGQYAPLTVASTGGLFCQVTGSVSVTAANLDIRDLTSASDSVECIQATAADLNMTEASAAAILADTNTLAGAVSGSEMQTDVLTVPAPLSTTGGGTEATALRVTIASDSTGLVSIDDGGGSVTVDNGGTFAVQSTLQAGSNAIGKLAANSGVDIGDVDVTSQPARDRTTDNQGVALQTDAIMNDTTVLTPKYVKIDAATSGDNTILAAVAGKKIRVLCYTIVAAGDVDVRWEDGASGTALTGQMDLTTNSGVSVAFCPVGHFETTANTILNLELSAAVSVDGHLTYVEV